MATNDLSGTWHSSYTYTSSAREGVFTSDYDIRMHRAGNRLVIESLPNEEDSYLVMRLTLEGRIATGVYEEHTSPKGFYKGVIYHGAVQLIQDKDGTAWRGKYVAFSRNMTVMSNDWVITRKK